MGPAGRSEGAAAAQLHSLLLGELGLHALRRRCPPTPATPYLAPVPAYFPFFTYPSPPRAFPFLPSLSFPGCLPRRFPPAAVDVEYIRGAQADLLAVFQAKACVSAAPCKWAAGEGMQQLLASARAGADRGAAELMESAEFIGGPVMSRQQQLEASIDQTRWERRRLRVWCWRVVGGWGGGRVDGQARGPPACGRRPPPASQA